MNLKQYCASQKLQFAGYNAKLRKFRCGVQAPGFNTYFWTKLRSIDLSRVCSRAHGTTRWRYQGNKVWCIVEVGANLSICNRRNGPIWTVVAHYVRPPRNGSATGWVTQGWWKVDAGNCRRLWSDRKYEGDIYLHATTKSGDLAGRDATMCINPGRKFKIGNADKAANCRAGGLKRAGMYKFAVKSGNNTFNFR
ncbi:MAG: DUF1036 domain-containing protein [Pseudomonadota bacterium]